ncbi:hypothetical protein GCM10009558_103720 [Virgisporangium aurantiacum]
MRDRHVLLVGDCGQLATALWAVGDVRTSVLTYPQALPRLAGPAEHEAVVCVPHRSSVRDWVDAAAWLHGRRAVTAVVAVEDDFCPHRAAIGAELGVPADSPELIQRVLHKPTLRAHLAGAGVDDTPYRVVGDAGGVARFGVDHGWPVIVKPATGTGSHGVSVVDCPADAATAIRRLRSDRRVAAREVLVERYHRGPQFSVEAFSERGEHEIVALTRKFSDPPHMIAVGQASSAALGPDEEERIRAYVTLVLDRTGVSDGPSFTELVLTDRGPRVFETHVRLPGGGAREMILAATGVDLAEAWARQLVGEQVLPAVRKRLREGRRTFSAVWFAYPDTDGVLRAVRGVKRARAVPGVRELGVLVHRGDRVRRRRSTRDMGAWVRTEDAGWDAAVGAAPAAGGCLSFDVNVAWRARELA